MPADVQELPNLHVYVVKKMRVEFMQLEMSFLDKDNHLANQFTS